MGLFFKKPLHCQCESNHSPPGSIVCPPLTTVQLQGLIFLPIRTEKLTTVIGMNDQYLTNTRHVCTYLNTFFVVIPNIVTKFLNVDFLGIFWQKFRFIVCSPNVQKTNVLPSVLKSINQSIYADRSYPSVLAKLYSVIHQ